MQDELVMVVPRAALFPEGRRAFQGFAAGDDIYLRAAVGEYLFMPRRRAESDERYKQIIPYVVIQAPPGTDGRFGYLFFQRASGGDPRLGRLYSLGLGGHINSADVQVRPVVRRSGTGAAAGAGAGAAGGAVPGVPSPASGPPPVVLRSPSLSSGTQRRGVARGFERAWVASERQYLAAEPAADRQARAPESRASTPAGRAAGELRRRLVRRIALDSQLKDTLTGFPGSRPEDHPLFRGLRRELREEVVMPAGCTLRYLGAINDDSNSVGRVHLGLAFVLEVPSRLQWAGRRRARGYGRVTARRAAGSARRGYRVYLRREPNSVQVGALFGLDDILTYRQAMESWSVLLLDSGLLPVRVPPSS